MAETLIFWWKRYFVFPY